MTAPGGPRLEEAPGRPRTGGFALPGPEVSRYPWWRIRAGGAAHNKDRHYPKRLAMAGVSCPFRSRPSAVVVRRRWLGFGMLHTRPACVPPSWLLLGSRGRRRSLKRARLSVALQKGLAACVLWAGSVRGAADFPDDTGWEFDIDDLLCAAAAFAAAGGASA